MKDFMQSGGTQYFMADPRKLPMDERKEKYRQCLALGHHEAMAVVNYVPEVWTCRNCGIRFKIEKRQIEVETLE